MPNTPSQKIVSADQVNPLQKAFVTDRLFYAVDKNDTAMIQDCLEKGADVDARKNNGDTPFLRSIRYGRGEEKTLKFLLANGADVDARDLDTGETALLITMRDRPNNKGMIIFLLANGADIFATDSKGYNVFKYLDRIQGNSADTLKEEIKAVFMEFLPKVQPALSAEKVSQEMSNGVNVETVKSITDASKPLVLKPPSHTK